MNNDNIQIKVADLLINKGLKLALAESCTGGMIAAALTDIPGSSEFFERGFVTYSNLSKIEMLGVSIKTLEDHGAVSKETAIEMSKGALKKSAADVTIAVTGIAGPTGGTADKPVGTVHISCATYDTVLHKKFQFSGDRSDVRASTMENALMMLIEMLSG